MSAAERRPRNPRTRAAAEERARRQTLVASLGQKALLGAEIGDLLADVPRLIAQALGAERAWLLEMRRDGSFLLRAGAGFPDELVGMLVVPPGSSSQAGYTIQVGESVISDDSTQETRFVILPLHKQHGVRSSVSVPIPGAERPFGVIASYSTEVAAFEPSDAVFLGEVATTIGAAIDLRRAEEARRQLDATRLRQRQALEINDAIVQGLATAQLAFGLGMQQEGMVALDRTFATARRLVSQLLGDGRLYPGDLLRSTPASAEQHMDELAALDDRTRESA